jgi:hypothetical protein
MKLVRAKNVRVAAVAVAADTGAAVVVGMVAAVMAVVVEAAGAIAEIVAATAVNAADAIATNRRIFNRGAVPTTIVGAAPFSFR